MRDISIVWFRNDLRVRDNEALTNAVRMSDAVLPVYVFDPRVFEGKTRFGFPKTGRKRALFIRQSVANLRKNLRALGLDLFVAEGHPEDVLFELARSIKSSNIYANRERTHEEVMVQNALEQKLWTLGQELIFTRGKMLYYTSDLPFPITHTPDSFNAFRKETEHFTPIRLPLPIPKRTECILAPVQLDFDWLPSFMDEEGNLSDMGGLDCRFEGGEDHALARLNYFIWEKRLLSQYKENAQAVCGWDTSSKLSAYLAQGCISPKYLYHEVERFENEVGANESTYQLKFELLMRDFLRLMGKKYKNAIFQMGGILGKADGGKEDQVLFRIWAEGRTGLPLVDACMRELNQTGYLSNRGRQVVASFLVYDMKINWQMGAEYFESQLIDYDPCSNYGNWMFLSGHGSESRDNRKLNVRSQALRYDAESQYVKTFIPELSGLPSSLIHQLHETDETTLLEYDLVLGRDYPKALPISTV